ncbi:hypothetical protein ACFC4G_41955 [Streptomyces sp. NPDC056002]|uniref:hypothetical protein n=1 Tax=Streptomyces sp. NPDC056002 TaxID=3345675 RepID=UPI0035E298D2
MTDQLDAQLDKALDNVRDMLPESVLLRLEAKTRQIPAERPDLKGQEVVNMAFDVAHWSGREAPRRRQTARRASPTHHREQRLRALQDALATGA